VPLPRVQESRAQAQEAPPGRLAQAALAVDMAEPEAMHALVSQYTLGGGPPQQAQARGQRGDEGNAVAQSMHL